MVAIEYEGHLYPRRLDLEMPIVDIGDRRMGYFLVVAKSERGENCSSLRECLEIVEFELV